VLDVTLSILISPNNRTSGSASMSTPDWASALELLKK